MGATLLFNVAHYALRPWPWIIVALGSLVLFPTLDDIQRAFPTVEADKIGHDLGYPAMMTLMPAGLAGLIVASLAAAYMSTIATHLNWGASYVVNDVYKRFIRPEASEKDQVQVGRLSTVLLMILASLLALTLDSALSAFNILLQIGAGTGLLFILRWFWWRINAYSELAAMVLSFVVALVLNTVNTGLSDWQELLIGVAVTTVGWVTVTLLTPPTQRDVLLSFYKHIRPEAAGWKPVVARGLETGALRPEEISAGVLPRQILSMLIGCLTVYGALFSTGYLLYGNYPAAAAAAALALAGGWLLFRWWR
jgi:Na+/proline symporter